MPLKSELVHDLVFNGGAMTQRSGGLGPDSYLFRRLPRKPWVRVEIRTNNGREAYQEDLECLAIILKHCRRVHRAALQRKWQTLWGPKTMSASEFLAKYGGD